MHYIAGYCPTGDDSMYAYLVEDSQNCSRRSPPQSLAAERGLADACPGPGTTRVAVVDPPRVDYPCFERRPSRRRSRCRIPMCR
jgi:hypothetical protein